MSTQVPDIQPAVPVPLLVQKCDFMGCERCQTEDRIGHGRGRDLWRHDGESEIRKPDQGPVTDFDREVKDAGLAGKAVHEPGHIIESQARRESPSNDTPGRRTRLAGVGQRVVVLNPDSGIPAVGDKLSIPVTRARKPGQEPPDTQGG